MENTNVYPEANPHALETLARDLGARLRWTVRAIGASNLKLALTLGGGALILRVAWVLAIDRKGFAFGDAFFYDTFAQQLANGHGYTHLGGAPTASWPPAYPFLLSIPFRIFGEGQNVAELTNAVIGAATVPLLYYVALRTFGRREAIFCACALAVFPVQIYLTDVVLTETLATFLLVALLALVVALPRTLLAAVPVGLLIGVAALTRGEGFFLVVIPLAVWWPGLTMTQRVGRAAVLGACALLVVVPWTIRNERTLHARVLIATDSGQTLWAAHNPHAAGGPVYPPPDVVARFALMPKPQGEIAQDKFLREQAIKWARTHPADELGLIPKRFLSWLSPDSNALYTWVNTPAPGQAPPLGRHQIVRLSLIADMAWYWLLGAFAISLGVIARARNRALGVRRVPPLLRGIFAWFAVEAFLYCVVLFGQWRYHVTLEPLMLLLVAPVVCALWAQRSALQTALSAAWPPAIQGGKR